MSDVPFDELAEVYEAMIDWPKRLAAETPFFRRVFERCSARRIVDVACGTGRHAALFHSWGLEVEASDVSPEMIARAGREFGEPAGLHWAVRGFGEPLGAAGSFDAVTCVGNSLALAPDRDAAGQAVRHMLDATRAGGVVAVHVLNLWKLPEGPCTWQKCLRRTLSRGPTLIVKGVHRCGGTGYVDLLLVSEGGADGSPLRSHSVPFLGLRAEELESAAKAGGANWVEFYGGHHGQAYDPRASTDLIMATGK